MNLLGGGEFIFPDPFRADGKNASCLSIMFPNNKMLWHKRQEYPDQFWVFLLLKPDILWECDCAFYPTNAASTGLRHQPVEKFKTAAAFEAMFGDMVIRETRFEIQQIPRPSDLKAYLPTDVQAEVLVFDAISPDYITECYFHWYLGDVASKSKIVYPGFAFFPNAEWVKNSSEHIFYGFREQVNWR
ncbi:MAG: DarT ssDNA thymidine ADP-ribosyltransferase family protein [Neisseria sp.]|nr:DarT ssDNA thymidine ADP-ribosyltransferase family protein [Neisseria sp.]